MKVQTKNSDNGQTHAVTVSVNNKGSNRYPILEIHLQFDDKFSITMDQESWENLKFSVDDFIIGPHEWD